MYVGITPRLALVLTVFAVLASGLTGYYAHDSSYRLLMARTERSLQGSSQMLGQRLVAEFGAIASDARMYASLVNSSMNAAGDSVQHMSRSMLQVHNEYLQISVVDTRQGWQEKLTFVNNKGDVVRVATGAISLKPFVASAAQLNPGQVYLSDVIRRNRISGDTAEYSSVLVATPVLLANGAVSGALVVIRVDLNSLFTKIQAELPLDYRFYLADDHGALVRDPEAMDVARSNERPESIQALFPVTEKIVSGERDRDSTVINADVVAAFYRVQVADFFNERFFILGLSEPLSDVYRESELLAGNIWRIVLLFSCLALLIAWGVSQAVAQPLAQILASVRLFAAGNSSENPPLPTRRHDEIGLLARGVEDMQNQIRAQVTALEENRHAVMHMAHYDALTGLPNRMTFFSLLENAIAQAKRQGRKLAVLFVDLDHFKAINDRYGHQVGDELLLAVARRLQSGVRASDTAARLAGDEFVVLLNPIHNAGEATMVAEKLLQRFNQPLELEAAMLSIQASIGISLFPAHGGTPQALLEAADQAMYASKESGRNICCLAKGMTDTDTPKA
jgi:diguanylate cyclase (GGDEF)-like protein